MWGITVNGLQLSEGGDFGARQLAHQAETLIKA